MPWVRVFCVKDGKTRVRSFEDRREAWEYALRMEREHKGVICFVSG
jgi:hypothetical protein